jgi:hypothetical protein
LQSRNYGALNETHRQVEEIQNAFPEAPPRQPRNYEAVRETQYQTDERQTAEPEAAASPSPQPRNYQVLRDAQHESLPQTRSGVEEARATEEQQPERPVFRTWTHLGGMVPQHGSAIRWDKQNQEIIRMSDRGDAGTDRDGEGTSSPQQESVNENDPDLQEARAVVEEARRREAAERARQQERDRGGPER